MSTAIEIIPCYELTVGRWTRVSTETAMHDLITYVCESRRCLVWYIRSSGFGFKIEVPFEYVKETMYATTTPGIAAVTFFLDQPPLFFIENPIVNNGIYVGRCDWKRSTDWTEGAQASLVLRHDLVGGSVELTHVLRHFRLPLAGSPGTPSRFPPPVCSMPILSEIPTAIGYKRLSANHIPDDLTHTVHGDDFGRGITAPPSIEAPRLPMNHQTIDPSTTFSHLPYTQVSPSALSDFSRSISFVPNETPMYSPPSHCVLDDTHAPSFSDCSDHGFTLGWPSMGTSSAAHGQYLLPSEALVHNRGASPQLAYAGQSHETVPHFPSRLVSGPTALSTSPYDEGDSHRSHYWVSDTRTNTPRGLHC